MVKLTKILLVGIGIGIFTLNVGVQAETKLQTVGNGWSALTKQVDPFDASNVEIHQIWKGGFTFRCSDLNMRAPSYGFESLNFDATLTYVVDDLPPIEKKGSYSTYLGGSDLVTDDRYYSFKLKQSDIDAFKKGNRFKVAGKYSNSGWFTKELNLKGFTKAYNKMCQK